LQIAGAALSGTDGREAAPLVPCANQDYPERGVPHLKKNYILRTAGVLLIFCVFSLCILPGTMSKFTTRVSAGSAKVRAGIFEVAIQDGLNASSQPIWKSIVRGTTNTPFEFGMYETLLNSYLETGAPVSQGNHLRGGAGAVLPTSPGMVAPNPTGKYLIAPGTGGLFRVKVKNFSEVAVRLNIQVDPIVITGNADMSRMIQWWNGTAWVSTFPGVTAGANPLPAILEPLGTVDSEWERIFYWRWMFVRGATGWYSGATAGLTGWANPSDAADTNLARVTRNTAGVVTSVPTDLKLSMAVNVVQVD